MKQVILNRVQEMSDEIRSLHEEREAMARRDAEIETRLHQLVGAVYELQALIAHLDRQPEVLVTVVDPSAVQQAEQEHQNSQRSHQTSSGTDDQSTEK